MKLLMVAALVAALAGCGSSGSDADPNAKLSAKSLGAKTCVEVRTGIDAFNQHDYDSTVTHFKKAEVFAKLYFKKAQGKGSSSLLQAVDYYAHLPAKSYPEAARTSTDFARFKAITLGQCEPVDGPTPHGSDT
jgi:predicted small lipoprotein YifL